MKRITRIALIMIALIFLIILGRDIYEISNGGSWYSWTGFQGKSVWDLFEDIIIPSLIPIAVVLTAYFLNKQENLRKTNQAEANSQDKLMSDYFNRFDRYILEYDVLNHMKDSGYPSTKLSKISTTYALSYVDEKRKELIFNFINNTKMNRHIFEDMKFRGVTFSNLDFDNFNFDHTNFFSCKFRKTKFYSNGFIWSNFTDCEFTELLWIMSNKIDALQFKNCIFNESEINIWTPSTPHVEILSFSNCTFNHCKLIFPVGTTTKSGKIHLDDAHINNCDFENTDFSKLKFSNCLCSGINTKMGKNINGVIEGMNQN